MKQLLTISLFLWLAVCGCEKRLPDTLVAGGFDEEEMDLAITRARQEVDSFIIELANPTGTNHAVKAPVKDADETEHFWLTDVTFENGKFHGTINNVPGMVKNVKFGQKWTIDKTDISDWMFIRDGKIHGNYTLRPLLKTMPADEAAKLRSILVDE